MQTDFSKAISVLGKARKNGVEVFLEDEKVKVRVDKNVQIDPALLAEIRECKTEIGDFLLYDIDSRKHTGSTIARYPRLHGEKIPLSYGQEALWIIDQLDGSKQYQMLIPLRLRGQLNIQALEAALREVVNRHEVLRTVIRQENSLPFQYIREAYDWQMKVQAATELSGDPVALQKRIHEIFNEPYDLAADYMLKAHLLCLAAEDHVLIISMHHIAADGWSLSIIVRDLVQLYDAGTRQLTVSLPELPVQYADYARWQRRQQEEGHWQLKMDFWRRYLEGVARLELPLDYKRPSIQSTKGRIAWFEINKELSTALSTLSYQQNTTLFMTMLAAFNVLLYRYTGQEDICVGTAIAGRTMDELESLIGFFANTLVLRNDLSANPEFQSFLAQVKENTLNAYDHQDLPFEKIVEAAGQERDRSGNPLCQVLFNVQNIPEVPALKLGDVSLTIESMERDTSQFDLNISVVEKKDGLLISVEYCTDLFLPASIDRLFGHFITLLGSIVAQPAARIDELSLLHEQERSMLQALTVQPILSYPADKTVAEVFSAQATATPDATALLFEDTSLSYAELDAESNRLAAYLLQLGVEAESLVPVCLDRSADLIITLLGILKAGAAFVPLDPRYPQERIREMLSDTGYKIAITSSEYRDLFDSNTQILTLEALQPLLGLLPATSLPARGTADSLAYVMFTSGSTGRPKGVMVTQRNIVSLALGSGFLEWSASDVLLSTGSPSFDASTIEYWGTLLNGATLVLCAEDRLLDSAQLKEEINERSVTRMWFTAGWLNQLVDTDISVFDGLKTVMAGGEKLSETHISRLRTAYPDLKIINGYGPTENTTFSLTYSIGTVTPGMSIPIGYPLSNRTAYVLDSRLQQLPIGIPGELYVGGAGLSRGYLGQPELTSARFITHPINGERLYRTGDLARLLPDGSIAYLGRTDDQVKLRGFRIELGEIESVLVGSGLVSRSVVILRDDSGTKRLLAYVVPETNYDEAGILSYLSQRLPDYMLPAAIITLDVLPLTRNGKVDKRALPDPLDHIQHSVKYVAAQNETEAQLVHIWQEALQAERIGIHDDFFRLGGDSIIAIGVVSKLRQVFRRTVRLYDLYQLPTIHQLAAAITTMPLVSEQGNEAFQHVEKEIITLREDILAQRKDAADIADIYPMSDIQAGMIYASLLHPGQGIYHDQFVHLLPVTLDVALFEKAFGLLVEKHTILRTAFDMDSHITGLQIVYKQLPVHFDLIDQQSLDTTEAKIFVQHYLEEQRKSSIDYKRGPLWKGTLIRLKDWYAFVFQFHHAMLDGWSVAHLNTELNNLYLRLSEDKEVADLLVPLKCTYRHFVIENLVEKRSGSNAGFWQQQLDGYKRLRLFGQLPEPRRYIHTYDIAYWKSLKQRCEEDHISVKALFLGAFLFVTGMLTHEDEMTIGLTTNSRPIMEDGDRLLGCFLNTVPFRVAKPGKENSWNTYFTAIETQLKQLKERENLPLPEIARVAGELASDENPFFDILFNFTNFYVYDNINPGLFTAGHEAAATTASPGPGNDKTNTYLDFDVSITGDMLTVVYTQQRQLSCGRSLEDLHGWLDAVLSCYLHRYDAPIDVLTILSPAEVTHLLRELNQTASDYDTNATLVSLFEAQVSRTPDAIAIADDRSTLSYAALNDKSDKLAQYLRNEGVQPEMLVPLYAGRSVTTVIGMLGILKAGAAYVPIAPDYPAERVNWILEDTRASILLSGEENPAMARAIRGYKVVDITTAITQAVQQPLSDVHSKQLAYIIYTSGSTGQPKGVMVEHQSVVNLLTDRIREFAIGTADKVLIAAAFTFDASVEQLFVALTTGASVYIPQKEALLDPQVFTNTLLERGITHLDITPGLLKNIFPLPAQHHLRRIIVGGEECPAWLLAQLPSDISCYNEYGPTETTVSSIAYKYKNEGRTYTHLPIGRPLSNTKVLLLDRRGHLLPQGVSGEICIGGAGVSRGYLNRKALTAKSFIPVAFNNEYEGIIYRTGDLGTWLPDGNIAFLGRLDGQVKIRGYRIEPAEIEHVLLQSGWVQQAVVQVIGEDAAKRLVAYVSGLHEVSVTQLKDHLSNRLPEYMVPTAIVVMETMPLTSNDKIDRRALPVPTQLLSDDYSAPETDLQLSLCEIYGVVLGVAPEKISIHDDLFRLGGNSLQAIQLLNRINRQLGVNIRVVDIYLSKTVARLAECLERTASKHDLLVRLNNADDKTPMFMIHSGRGGAEVYTSLAEKLSEDYMCYGIEPYNKYHKEQLTTLQSLAAKYLEYIDETQAAVHNNSYTLLGWSLGGQIALEIAAILEARGVQDIRVFLLDTILPDGDEQLSALTERVIGITTNTPSLPETYEMGVLLLGNQYLSARLQHTTVTLFKAMQKATDTLLSDPAVHALADHIIQLPDNNVRQVMTDPARLKIIQLPHLHHENILSAEAIMLKEIRKDK